MIVKIFDSNGRLILEEKVIETDSEFNLSEYGKGIYYIKTQIDNEILSSKIIIQ